MPLSKNSSGFTIFEIFVVLGIMGIMALIAMPTFKPLITNIRLSALVKTVKQELNFVKIRALADPNVHTGFFLDTAGTPDSIVTFLDDNKDNLYTPGTDHLLMPGLSVPTSDTLKITTSYPDVVIFRGDGSAKSSAQFYIKSNFMRCDTISVLASTGRIKWTKNKY
jgi:Tfp pilus assembly protein FimT